MCTLLACPSDVNTHADHPGLCGRCIVNVTGRGEVRKYA